LRVADFDYELPEDRIAQRPAIERDGARLLVVKRERLVDSAIRSLAAHLPERALLVVNDTRVVPSRLYGQKRGSGGRVELLLVRPREGGARACAVYEALGRASKGLKVGTEIVIGDRMSATILKAPSPRASSSGDDGDRTLEVELRTLDGSDLDVAIEEEGHMPLPPYIDRPDDGSDRARYQTVFARVPGAIAAPTAGLHLSEALLAELRARDVEIATVTLHVGLGTFLPVTAVDLDDHAMHSERYEVSEETSRAIDRARARSSPVVAVGTTVVRALESAADPGQAGRVKASSGDTRLLIQPGYYFRVVDKLLTNFHLPKSTLLALVSAFAGTERVLGAYRHAVASGYRFYSYGDAMLLERA